FAGKHPMFKAGGKIHGLSYFLPISQIGPDGYKIDGSRPRFLKSLVGNVTPAILPAGKRYYIFGAGQEGRLALDWLRLSQRTVLGYFDNDRAKHRTQYLGFTVYPPQPVAEDCAIVIASGWFAEIHRQLLTMGVSPGQIHRYDEQSHAWLLIRSYPGQAVNCCADVQIPL
ncbi:MAG: hypothetical protein N3A57_06365, partial [Negativicutes bacterium]|nr:hypothetical protein [Negativicutes bacterium]